MTPRVVKCELETGLWADFWNLAHGLGIYVNDHPSERGIGQIEGIGAMRELVRVSKAVGYQELLDWFRFARDKGGRSERSEFWFTTERSAHEHEWASLSGKVLDRVNKEIRKAERQREVWLTWSAGTLGRYEDSGEYISPVDNYIKSLRRRRNYRHCKHCGLGAPEGEAA